MKLINEDIGSLFVMSGCSVSFYFWVMLSEQIDANRKVNTHMFEEFTSE